MNEQIEIFIRAAQLAAQKRREAILDVTAAFWEEVADNCSAAVTTLERVAQEEPIR